jgi:hypothetical protein
VNRVKVATDYVTVVHNLQKRETPSKFSRHQIGDMKPVPNREHTSVTLHCKFSAREICAPLD